nr:hypothetical protein [Tanacetum cinerariifolium]
EKRIEEEQTVKAQSWKFPVWYDDDDDEESSNPLEDNIISELPSMEDEHLDTIPATESNEFIKSCVENLVPNPKIDLFLNPDDPMPPSIEEDDDDSERDILILEELLDNYSLSLPTNESYHFDIPSPYRLPAKPPDGNTGTLNIKMMGGDCTIAITPKEPDNSLSMGDKHLETIPATESDKFIKSSVENLVPHPSESEGEHEYDVPTCYSL